MLYDDVKSFFQIAKNIYKVLLLHAILALNQEYVKKGCSKFLQAKTAKKYSNSPRGVLTLIG